MRANLNKIRKIVEQNWHRPLPDETVDHLGYVTDLMVAVVVLKMFKQDELAKRIEEVCARVSDGTINRVY